MNALADTHDLAAKRDPSKNWRDSARQGLPGCGQHTINLQEERTTSRWEPLFAAPPPVPGPGCQQPLTAAPLQLLGGTHQGRPALRTQAHTDQRVVRSRKVRWLPPPAATLGLRAPGAACMSRASLVSVRKPSVHQACPALCVPAVLHAARFPTQPPGKPAGGLR